MEKRREGEGGVCEREGQGGVECGREWRREG